MPYCGPSFVVVVFWVKSMERVQPSSMTAHCCQGQKKKKKKIVEQFESFCKAHKSWNDTLAVFLFEHL